MSIIYRGPAANRVRSIAKMASVIPPGTFTSTSYIYKRFELIQGLIGVVATKATAMAQLNPVAQFALGALITPMALFPIPLYFYARRYIFEIQAYNVGEDNEKFVIKHLSPLMWASATINTSIIN